MIKLTRIAAYDKPNYTELITVSGGNYTATITDKKTGRAFVGKGTLADGAHASAYNQYRDAYPWRA